VRPHRRALRTGTDQLSPGTNRNHRHSVPPVTESAREIPEIDRGKWTNRDGA
jgi:hypothetical protein